MKHMKQILHYGLQRSGTNYLEALLKKRFRVRFLNSNRDRSSPLQKHFRLYDDKSIIPEPQYSNSFRIEQLSDLELIIDRVPDYYLVISKDPYSWLLSYREWANRCNWPAVSHHYLTEYNLFYRKWLDLSSNSDRVIFVRYIDLLGDTDRTLDGLAAVMQLVRKPQGLWRFNRRLTKVSQSDKFSDEKRRYYLLEEFLDRITKEDLRSVNKLIDPDVATRLGYRLRVT